MAGHINKTLNIDQIQEEPAELVEIILCSVGIALGCTNVNAGPSKVLVRMARLAKLAGWDHWQGQQN